MQFEIAKARIKSKLINDLPSLEHFTNGVDEISILKRELNKQRRIMPIRRLFKAICIEELSEAMFRVLQTCVGTTREALCSETTRVYGFNRAGQNISSAMSNAVNALISTGRVEEIEGKLKIKGE